MLFDQTYHTLDQDLAIASRGQPQHRVSDTLGVCKSNAFPRRMHALRGIVSRWYHLMLSRTL